MTTITKIAALTLAALLAACGGGDDEAEPISLPTCNYPYVGPVTPNIPPPPRNDPCKPAAT